jgi:hypothetical protein
LHWLSQKCGITTRRRYDENALSCDPNDYLAGALKALISLNTLWQPTPIIQIADHPDLRAARGYVITLGSACRLGGYARALSHVGSHVM